MTIKPRLTLSVEWPCYIVQSAIVPGFMYLTDNHICFYASLPKNQASFFFFFGKKE